MKNKVVALTPKKKVKKNKNKKTLKRINKAITQLEKQVTKLFQVSEKLRALRSAYTDKKIA